MFGNKGNRRQRILFFSAGDATRSRMAEGFLRMYAGDEFDVMSSAVASGATHPLAPEVMREASIELDRQPFESVADTLRDQFSCVISICDETRERYPIFPFSPRFMRWNIPAPDAGYGSRDYLLDHLRHVRETTNERVKQFMIESEQDGEAASSATPQSSRPETKPDGKFDARPRIKRRKDMKLVPR